MELENSQNPAITMAFMEIRWTLVLIMSVKDRGLQGRNKHSHIIEPAVVNGLREIHNVLFLSLYILFTIN